MDLDLARRLLEPEGAALLAALPEYDEATAMNLGASLREGGYDADLVAAAMSQSRLRHRARAKFGDFAAGMLFTPDGLEQATRLEIAARHAQRFRSAGVAHVLDLGCGLGADAMAMASLGMDVTAVDQDPVTALLAGNNLRHFPGTSAMCAAAADVPLTVAGLADRGGAWLDPARRTPGSYRADGRTRRVTGLDGLSPSWEFVKSVAAAVPATGVKLAPSFPHAMVPAGAEAAWTSYRGDVLECAIWWGPLVRHAGRTATLVGGLRGDGPDVVVTQTDAAELGPVLTDGPSGLDALGEGKYLYDPDRAVVRAGLVGALVAAVDGAELSHGAGYVASPHALDVGYARRYVVTAAMPLSIKPVRAWLRARGVGRLTIKKRGVDVDADLLRRQLRLDGTGSEMTVVLARVGSKQTFIAVEPD